jgi:FO synthase
VFGAADALRRETNGDRVSYVVNRNINYTNIARITAGSRFRRAAARSRATRLPDRCDEIASRTGEAWDCGATESACRVHPSAVHGRRTDIVAAVKRAEPAMHVHAFSPLEVTHGARTLDPTILILQRPATPGLRRCQVPRPRFSRRGAAGPVSGQTDTQQWLDVMRGARDGLRTTATIMFGIDTPGTGRATCCTSGTPGETHGFTEFVPLAFVPWRRRLAQGSRAVWADVAAARCTPAARAVSRDSEHQSRVKMGPRGPPSVSRPVRTISRHADERTSTRAGGGRTARKWTRHA